MERVMMLQHPPIVGETYLVPCVLYSETWWPIIGRPHSDPVLGEYASRYHAHIDARFVDHLALKRVLNADIAVAYYNGLKPFVRILAIMSSSFDPIEEHEMICLRDAPVYQHRTKYQGRELCWFSGESLSHFASLEDMMEAKEVKGACKACPHHGTPLASTAPIDGVVTCPSHMLDWSATTGKLVRRTKWHRGFACHRTHQEKDLDTGLESRDNHGVGDP